MSQRAPIQTCVGYGMDFVSTGAVKMGAVKSFQGGSHIINRQVPETFAQSPLPLETFLHIQTWNTKYPRLDKDYALVVWFPGITVLAFNLSTLYRPLVFV